MKIIRKNKQVEELFFEFPDEENKKVGEFVKFADKTIYLHLDEYTALTIECLKKILKHLETQE